jgi:Rps23 Pro-64 3,4-dihydroxylase Tpa1-like proline 4-hydroxylase
MRFLNYADAGSALTPHVDLYKIDGTTGSRSTHTFILYLTDCAEGGETALLRDLQPSSEVITKVFPRKGRLLLFPHACPHEGGKVISTPKLLLRGEVMIQ